jgi:hypothetical protein
MKDCNTCDDNNTDGLESGLKSLINAQLLLGKEVLKLLGSAGRSAGSMASGIHLPKGSTCCDVPEPCWMPLALGEVNCVLRPGDSGTVCLVVTNGDFRPHTYQFAATGKSAAHVSFSTASATLGPKERIAVTATFTVPRDSKDGEDCRCIDHDALLWVRGCRNHYLRWTVDELACSKACCHEIVVNDDPDYVLHWYDHFYVTRPCFGAASTPGSTNTGVIGVVR